MTEDFQNLAREIAMQVVAMSPKYVSPEEVPDEVIQKEKEILREQAISEGKPENVVEKVVEGRFAKFLAENCLLEQPWIKDSTKTVEDLINEYIAKLGENIKVKRFCRFQIGE
jgi:elongation factor Ts